MKRKLNILFVFSLFYALIAAQSGEEIGLNKIIEFAGNYNQVPGRQKVFLHIDKKNYFQNEKIWFKAYVCSGPLLLPDSTSKNLYIELWTPSNIKANIIRVKLTNGVGEGNIFLPDTLEQGIFQLRAFTDLMLNYSSEYYFNYNFEFNNSNHQYLISPKQARKNKRTINKIGRQKEKYNLFLYPKGGEIIADYPTQIFFKSVNTYGDRTGVTVKLIQDDNDSIILISNAESGIGDFTFVPVSGEKYRIEAAFSNNKTGKYSLPESKIDGVWGHLETIADSIKLKLSKPELISADPSANRYYIIIHSNNFIKKVVVADLRKDTILIFPKVSFPPGIINFSVFSNRLQNEANFKTFIYPEIRKTNVSGIKEVADSVCFIIDASMLSSLKSASLSVVETNSDSNFIPDFNTAFFLNSDIAGWFPDNINLSDMTNNREINCLINTMENKTPEWRMVFQKYNRDLLYKAEDGVIVAGRITTELLSIPIKNAKVRLEVMSRYNDVFETTTDNKGNFMFSGFDFYDTLQMKIIARKPSGRKNVLIELRNDPIPEVTEFNGNFFLTTKSMRDNKAYNKQMNIKASEEARRKERELEEFYKGTIHGRPDNIIYGTELPQNTNVLDALHGRVPGMNISGDQILIRGRNTILGSTDPYVLVDDMPSDVSILKNISTNDVERIEILKGPSTSIYGLRGGNGVIVVHTKTGSYMKHGEIDFTLVGYQKPEIFSNNSNNSEKKNIATKTVIWIPEICKPNIEKSEIKCVKPSTGKILLMQLWGINENGQIVFQKIVYPEKN